MLIGHRGAPEFRPENTLSSFRYAIDAGVDAIELDVHLVEDELVVIHDNRLERTTNGRGSIYRKTLMQLSAYDAGNKEHIPLLKEVLDLLPESVGINVELKGDGTAKPLIDLVRKRDFAYERLLVSSFKLDELKTVARIAPELQIAYLRASFNQQYLEEAIHINASAFNLIDSYADAETTSKIKATGMRLLVFTVNDRARIEELQQMGADGVFSDNPHLRPR